MLKQLAVTLAVLVTLVIHQRVLGADEQGAKPGTTAAPTDHVSAPGGEHGGAHDGHVAIDDRLVPIPPSKETLISSMWVVIIFIVLLAILYPTAWRNVLAGLKKREERIRGDIAAAEEQRRKSEAVLKQYNDQLAQAEARVRDMLTKAQVDGEKLATNIRMQAQQEAESAKERATKEIDASKTAAIREIHEYAAGLATNVAEKILRRNLNEQDQADLVRQSLAQLQTISKN